MFSLNNWKRNSLLGGKSNSEELYVEVYAIPCSVEMQAEQNKNIATEVQVHLSS